MRLLDRYLLRELLIPLSYCLIGFLVFWVSSDLLTELDDFQRRQMSAPEVVDYYLLVLPEMFVTIMPVGLLLALLYTLTQHARHNELTAIRAAGVSVWRLAVPYLAVGFLFTATLFGVNEFWVPQAEERARELLTRHEAPQEAAGDRSWRRDFFFINRRDNRTWQIGAYNLETHEMVRPNVDWRLPDGSRREIYAQRGIRTNGMWVFFDARELVTPPEDPANPGPVSPNLIRRSHADLLALDEFTETPDQIKSEIAISGLDSLRAAKRPELPIRTIREYLSLNPDPLPELKAKLKTQLHGRLAAPWTCLVVVLIAVPFAAASGRRNPFVGVASSVFLCFAFFVLLRFGLALGTGGYVPGWLAAWLPNLLFGGAGIWMTSHVR